MPSTIVNLAPSEDRWVTIDIPNTSLQGQSLRGHYLYAKAIVDSHTYWLNDFLDSAFNIDIQVYSEKYNSDGTVSVTVEFSNIGYINRCNVKVHLNSQIRDGRWPVDGWHELRCCADMIDKGWNSGYNLAFLWASAANITVW